MTILSVTFGQLHTFFLLFAKFEAKTDSVKFVEIDRWDFETLETTFYTDKKHPNKIKYPSNKKKARLEKIERDLDDNKNVGTNQVISDVSGLEHFDLSLEGTGMILTEHKPDLFSCN